MHRWHQFSQQTTNNSLPHNSGKRRSRGSIGILSVTWLALSFISCSVVVRASHVVMQRAKLQEAADALALGALQHSNESLSALANVSGVALISVTRSENSVRVEVKSTYGSAFSEALMGF